MANQDKGSGAAGVKSGVKPDVKKNEAEGNRSADQKNPNNPQQPRNEGDMREPGRNEGGNRDRKESGSPDDDRNRRGGDQADGKR